MGKSGLVLELASSAVIGQSCLHKVGLTLDTKVDCKGAAEEVAGW